MWTMTNATSLQSHFKIRLEKETQSFTYKLAFHHLITTIVLHERHKVAMLLSRQLTSVLSHAVYPSLPGESLPLLADILFTIWLSAAAPEWRVWFLPPPPNGILSQSQHCSCIPQKWVTTRARGKELHLSVYSPARLVHNVKTNKHIEQSVTSLLLCDNQRKRETHPQRWTGQWQEIEHNSPAELVITCLMCSLSI